MSKVTTANTASKGRGGQRRARAKPKARAGVKGRAAKRGVLNPSHSAAGFRRTLDDERSWLD